MELIYMCNPVVVLREESDDWAILYNPDNGLALGTNPLGVDVWKKIDGKKSINDIFIEIKQEYENVSSNAENDIREFVNDLLNHGLINLR